MFCLTTWQQEYATFHFSTNKQLDKLFRKTFALIGNRWRMRMNSTGTVNETSAVNKRMKLIFELNDANYDYNRKQKAENRKVDRNKWNKFCTLGTLVIKLNNFMVLLTTICIYMTEASSLAHFVVFYCQQIAHIKNIYRNAKFPPSAYNKTCSNVGVCFILIIKHLYNIYTLF